MGSDREISIDYQLNVKQSMVLGGKQGAEEHGNRGKDIENPTLKN